MRREWGVSRDPLVQVQVAGSGSRRYRGVFLFKSRNSDVTQEEGPEVSPGLLSSDGRYLSL